MKGMLLPAAALTLAFPGLGTVALPSAAGGEPEAPLALAAPITMKSGVYNPWTDRCSDPKARVRKKMYVRQPSGPGPYPVFLYLIGTLRSHDNETARGIVDRAAARGFVAAAVDYDTIAFDFKASGACDTIEAKAACTLSVGSPQAPEAALKLICDDVRLDGSRAGLRVDCDLGVVVAGFSQGASLAMMARNYEERVRAVWAIGHHDQALPDRKPLQCVHGEDGRPPGPRRLSSEALRVVVGEGDRMLRGPHQDHLEAVTGRTCGPGTLGPCFAEDGSGWGIVPNDQCTRKCAHEYLDDGRFWESGRWWGADENLDWLGGFVSPPRPGR